MSNRDDFDACAAFIFHELYKAFPQEVFLDPDDHEPDADDNTTRNFSMPDVETAKVLLGQQVGAALQPGTKDALQQVVGEVVPAGAAFTLAHAHLTQ